MHPRSATFLCQAFTHLLGHALHALVLLLLALRHLLQPLEGFVHLLLRLTLGATLLDRLVLIALLVRLQLEQIGEILGALLTAAAAPTAAPTTASHLDLDVTVDRLGALQPLQGTLLRRHGVSTTRAPKLLFGGLQFDDGLLQLRADLGEVRVCPCHTTFRQALHQLFDIGTKATFRNGQRGHVFTALLVRTRGTVTHPVERG